MRAGRLDRRISIQRKTVGASDSGEPLDQWETIADRRPASMSPVRGDETFSGEQLNAFEQIEFRTRYSQDIADLTPLDRIIHPALGDDEQDGPVVRRIHDVLQVSEIGRREGFKIITQRRPEVLVVLEVEINGLDFSDADNSGYLALLEDI